MWESNRKRQQGKKVKVSVDCGWTKRSLESPEQCKQVLSLFML